MPADKAALQFILKIVSRCNLNCSYCYVYHKGDDSWRLRPGTMSEEIFEATVQRIRNHCVWSGQRSVCVTFHGGEPCLLGVDQFRNWCRHLRETLQDLVRVNICIQTNGTMIDEGWVKVFKDQEVDVGISIDGPQEQHDRFRVDHHGRGSYETVARGIGHLRRSGLPVQLLSVVQPGDDGLRIHRHLVELGAKTINYLLPDYTYDTVRQIWSKYGPTPCADYLIPIFDEWWGCDSLVVKVSIFWSMARLIFGGDSELDLLGNPPLRFAFVETDGGIEALDVLRGCKSGISGTGLNVLADDFIRIREVSELHRATIFTGMPLPTNCRGCPEETTCAGGYLPHRYSTTTGFDNPSVWCADLLRLFNHMRERLGISHGETAMRREVLAGLATE